MDHLSFVVMLEETKGKVVLEVVPPNNYSVMLPSRVWHSGLVLYLVCSAMVCTPCLDTSGVGGRLASMLIFSRSHCGPSADWGLVSLLRLLGLLSDT